MKTSRIFFCFIVVSLQVGNSGSFKEINHYYRLPGEDLSITCSLSPGPRRIFCRENCQGENVLINTTSNKETSGRNSIEYSERVHDKSYNLTVRVSNVTHSDSGLYRCGLSDSPSTFVKFKAVVAEALLDGSKDHHLYKDAGSSLTVACSFGSSGKTKYFCRGGCEEEENILVYTDGVRAQSGRYSIGHSKHKSSDVFYVTIKNLTQSDSGRYRCLSYLNRGKKSYLDFNVFVSDALLDGSKDHHLYKDAGSSLTVACSFGFWGRNKSFCRGGCGADEVLVQTDGVRAESSRYKMEYEEQKSGTVLMVTITQLIQTDSGWYQCKLDGNGSISSYRDFHVTVRTAVVSSASTPTASFTPAASQLPSSLYVPVIVGVTLAAMVVLVSAALLVSCRRRSLRDSRRRGDDGVKMENIDYDNVSSHDSTYQSLSPATRDQNQIYSTLSQPR